MSRSHEAVDVPLRPTVMHILLALSEEPLHGLGIADAVESLSDGALRLGPATLYRTLKEMTDAGFVRPAETGPGTDPRRKCYEITAAGRESLSRDAARLARLVEAARHRAVIADRG